MAAVPSTMGELSFRGGGGLGTRRGDGEGFFRRFCRLVGEATLPSLGGSGEPVVWPCVESEGAPPSISRRARLTPASVRENLGGGGKKGGEEGRGRREGQKGGVEGEGLYDVPIIGYIINDVNKLPIAYCASVVLNFSDPP